MVEIISVVFAVLGIYMLTYVGLIFYSMILKDNKALFKKKFYEIDDTFIVGYGSDGEMSKVPFSHVIRILEAPGYYLLFVSKDSFLYIPFEAFYTTEDRNSFKALLESKQLSR
jgi:hypothetical protein